MRLEDQVVNLELSKELKSLGVKQESVWAWMRVNSTGEIKLYTTLAPVIGGSILYSAFTVAELGEMISNAVKEWSQGWSDSGVFWHFQYGPRGSGSMIEGIGHTFNADYTDDLDEVKEANSRAEFYIHLIKEGIVKV